MRLESTGTQLKTAASPFAKISALIVLSICVLNAHAREVFVAPAYWEYNIGVGPDPGAAALDYYKKSNIETAGTSCHFVAPWEARCETTLVLPDGSRPKHGSIPGIVCPVNVGKINSLCAYYVTDDVGNPDKNLGPPCPACGNPVSPANGNKFQLEVDFETASGLKFSRAYNSLFGRALTSIGQNWRHAFDRKLSALSMSNGMPSVMLVERPDGRSLRFALNAGVWSGELDGVETFRGLENGNWTLTTTDDSVELFDVSGKLLSITDRSGRTTSLHYSDGTSTWPGGDTYDGQSSALPGGLLIRITDHFGRAIRLRYQIVVGDDNKSHSHITLATSPDGQDFRYSYDAKRRLVSVQKPGAIPTFRVYHYNEQTHTSQLDFPYALTGITDENSHRYATFTYTGTSGYSGRPRANSTAYSSSAALPPLVNKASISFGSGNATVTESLGATTTYTFQDREGVLKNNSRTRPCDDPVKCPNQTATETKTFDVRGNIESHKDFNGNVSCYTYHATRNLEFTKKEGLSESGTCLSPVTTPATRRRTTVWHDDFRLIRRIAEPLRISTLKYQGDTGGVDCGAPTSAMVCERSIQATTDTTGEEDFAATPVGNPRVWKYEYNANGLIVKVDGPRVDLNDFTTFSYFAANDPSGNFRTGELATTTNALGHVTTFTHYDGAGRPKRMVDANGLVTELEYWPRGWLESRRLSGGASIELTQYAYDAVGNLARVTQPDGSWINFSYDGAHRLVGIDDGFASTLVNSIDYELDAAGNRFEEKTFAPGSILKRKVKREFDVLGRLWKSIANTPEVEPATTTYGYDAAGNLKNIAHPSSLARPPTTQAFDALNRLAGVTSSDTGVIGYEYDGIDQLRKVTDPRALATTYALDGLGNQSVLASPDTGTTTFNLYDAAGNLKTATDARGKAVSYTYDALNRVASASYSDQEIAYTYDQGANGIGRLTGVSDASGSIEYAYDPMGRVTSDSRLIGTLILTTAYGYDTHGRLASITYPSGHRVDFGFDGLGRVTSATATAGAASWPLVSSATYHPFGGVSGFNFGASGPSHARGQDLDGRVSSYTLGTTTFALSYDDAGNVTRISDPANPALDRVYGYDAVDRLISFESSPATLNQQYWYDLTGNREKRRLNGVDVLSTIDGASNRMTALDGVTRTHDAVGSFTSGGALAYDDRGRLKQAVSAAGTFHYAVNALGQRVRKLGPGIDRYFAYDLQGRLIGEYGPAGLMVREYVWVGDLLVATLDVTTPIADYNADHRADMVLRNSQTGVAWAWMLHPPPTEPTLALFAEVDPVWDLVGLEDMNADGKRDAVWRHSTNGGIYVWFMDGVQFLGSSPVGPGYADNVWRVSAVVDINGDGKPDMIWRNKLTGDVWAWYMDGVTWLSNQFLLTLAPTANIVGAADFNLDGHNDLVVRDNTPIVETNATSGTSGTLKVAPVARTYEVWYMNGPAVTSQEELFWDTPGWSVDHVGDLNRDGRPDLVYKHAASGVAYLLTMEDRVILGNELFYSLDPVWQHQSVIESHQKAGAALARPVTRPVPPDLVKPAPVKGRTPIRIAMRTQKPTGEWKDGPIADWSRLIPPGPPTPGPKASAKIAASRIAVHHVHSDHLGTPRLITRAADNAPVWRWDNDDPFGDNAPVENPTGLGAFAFNLRFPGQYFDQETGLHYNYFRDYDPKIGRYIESDPIGIFGGLQTFGYVHSTPLLLSDPTGLLANCKPTQYGLYTAAGQMRKNERRVELFGGHETEIGLANGPLGEPGPSGGRGPTLNVCADIRMRLKIFRITHLLEEFDLYGVFQRQVLYRCEEWRDCELRVTYDEQTERDERFIRSVSSRRRDRELWKQFDFSAPSPICLPGIGPFGAGR